MLVSAVAIASDFPSIENAKIDAPGCGQRPLARNQPMPYVVGGREVDPKYSWPFIVRLLSLISIPSTKKQLKANTANLRSQ